VTELPEPSWAHSQPAAPRRRPLLTAALSAGVFVVIVLLGAPLGWLWQRMSPDIPVQFIDNNGKLSGIVPEGQPEEFAAADGWFALLGLGFGVLVAIGVWVLVKRLRGPVGLAVTVLGCVVAAYVAWQLGRRLGLDAYQDAITRAIVGTELQKPSNIRVTAADWWPADWKNWRVQGVLLVPALGAVLTTTLLAGFSIWPSLHREPERALATTPEPERPQFTE
jgi:hypothetical protein